MDQLSETIKKERWKFNSHKWIVQNIPFFLFLGALAVVYIYNGHMADKMIRNIARSERNIRELEYEYKSLKSEVIYRSKASELAKVVEPLGLQQPNYPPAILDTTLLKQDKK